MIEEDGSDQDGTGQSRQRCPSYARGGQNGLRGRLGEAEAFRCRVVELLRSRANVAETCGHTARAEAFTEIACIVAEMPAY